ncbi:hypothetical protein BGZ67_001806 [Mortierella alpina]|nr:hypothetical protein BGZ67_001806 [Mortierella alpina]
MAVSNASNTGGAEAGVLTERLTVIDSTNSPVLLFHADAHIELPGHLGPLVLAADNDDEDSAVYEAAAPSAEPAPTATHKPKPKGRPKKKKPRPRKPQTGHTQVTTATTYTQSSSSFAPTPASSHINGEVSPTSADASPTETHNPEVNTDKPTTAPRPNPDTRDSHSDTPPTPVAARTTTTNAAEVTPIITATSTLSTATRIVTATTAATTAVATPPTPVSSHGSRPTKPTTPWLPSSIVPIVAPPKITSTPSPGTSLPDAVIPDLKPNIPAHSMNVQLRLERVSYAQVIDNGVLAAQLVSFIPAQLSYLLDVEQSKILVLVIRDGTSAPAHSGNDKKKRDLVTSTNADDAILVTIAIPREKYHVLDALVQNRSSMLYFPSATGFGQFVDPHYPLSAHPPSKAVPGGDHEDDGHDDDDDNTADPLTGENPGVIPNPNKNRGEGVGHGPIIGSVVGLATAAYVGIAMLIVRRYRRRKLREQQREALQQSISAPIHVSGSTQAWAWHGS